MAVLNNRILVVEDEDVIRLVLSALLAEKGYAMTCASTGSEALSLAAHENYAVALVGMLVPPVNGLEVLAQLKQRSPDTEVLIMTARASLESALEAMRRGAYDTIQKPFERADVEEAVAHALEKRRLTLQNRALVVDLERQNDRLKSTANRLASLHAAGMGMSVIRALPELLSFYLELVTEELDVERASVMLRGDDDVMRIVASRGLDGAWVDKVRVRPGEGVAGRVLATGQPVVVNDFVATISASQNALPGPYASFPITLSMPVDVIGTLNLTHRKNGQPFDKDDVAYLSALAGQLAGRGGSREPHRAAPSPGARAERDSRTPRRRRAASHGGPAESEREAAHGERLPPRPRTARRASSSRTCRTSFGLRCTASSATRVSGSAT
jgi:CheY-like chemotaxis protein